MAKNKKNKQSYHQKDKLAKAQHRNEYMRKFHYYINLICGTEIYKLIPNYVYEYEYHHRFLSVKIDSANGHDIPSSEIKLHKAVIAYRLNEEKIEFFPGGPEITFKDYFTVISDIYHLDARLGEDSFPQATKVIEALKDFKDKDNDLLSRVLTRVNFILLAFGTLSSNLEKSFYWFNFTIDYDKDNPRKNIQYLATMCRKMPEIISVEIEGSKRPVTRVGWPYALEGMRWASIKAKDLNIETHFGDLPMDVYMQEHAIKRFAERMDTIYISLMQMFITLSINNPKVCLDKNNNLLIEYKIFDIKAGYFRADIIGGKVIIRTFLFITNNSTPEGQLLEKIHGIKKLDKKYLAIDKLSTFLDHDIGSNNELRKIFVDVGCESLIVLYDKLSNFRSEDNHQSPIEFMLKYLSA